MCSLLKDNNKLFTRNYSKLNLTLGTTVNAPQEIQVHNYIINAVTSILLNINIPLQKTRKMVYAALEPSVFIKLNLAFGTTTSKFRSRII